MKYSMTRRRSERDRQKSAKSQHSRDRLAALGDVALPTDELTRRS